MLAKENRRLASAPARVHHLYTATKTNELEPYAGDEVKIKLGFKYASERKKQSKNVASILINKSSRTDTPVAY